MAPSLLSSNRPPVARFIVLSLLAHAALIGAGLLYQSYAPSTPAINLDQKPIHASLVRLGKPRDAKLLPKKEELPPPPKQVEATPEPVPTPIPAAKTPVVGFLDKPKPKETKLVKQAGEATAPDRKKQLFGAFSRTGKAAASPELEGKATGDPNGDSAVQEGEQYWGLLNSQVRQHYDVSDTIPDQERIHLKAQVALQIGKLGEVLHASLVKPSGNALFDSAVLSAVKKASPFSPPPESLRDSLKKSGIVLEFTP